MMHTATLLFSQEYLKDVCVHIYNLSNIRWGLVLRLNINGIFPKPKQPGNVIRASSEMSYFRICFYIPKDGFPWKVSHDIVRAKTLQKPAQAHYVLGQRLGHRKLPGTLWPQGLCTCHDFFSSLPAYLCFTTPLQQGRPSPTLLFKRLTYTTLHSIFSFVSQPLITVCISCSFIHYARSL